MTIERNIREDKFKKKLNDEIANFQQILSEKFCEYVSKSKILLFESNASSGRTSKKKATFLICQFLIIRNASSFSGTSRRSLKALITSLSLCSSFTTC